MHDPGVEMSSPICGKEDTTRKRAKKKAEAEATAAAASMEMNARFIAAGQDEVANIINKALGLLQDHNITFAEAIHHVSDPQHFPVE